MSAGRETSCNDGKDNDCDGKIDDADEECSAHCIDADNDLYDACGPDGKPLPGCSPDWSLSDPVDGFQECDPDDSNPNICRPPVIVYFNPATQTIPQGQRVPLSWKVFGMQNSIYLDDFLVPYSDDTTLPSPGQNHVYVLKASNHCGSVQKTSTVTVS